jgi:hypothetical protein
VPETNYDAFLMSGIDRRDARAQIRPVVEAIMATWTGR